MWFAWRLSGLPTRQSGNQGRHASGSGAAYALTLAVMACKPSLILGGKLLGAGECFEVVSFAMLPGASVPLAVDVNPGHILGQSAALHHFASHSF